MLNTDVKSVKDNPLEEKRTFFSNGYVRYRVGAIMPALLCRLASIVVSVPLALLCKGG